LAILAAIVSFGSIGLSLAQQAQLQGLAQVTPAPTPVPAPSGTRAAPSGLTRLSRAPLAFVQLKVSFQDLAKETMTIPMPLTDFAAAYDEIK
jgi:hypothetical protein